MDIAAFKFAISSKLDNLLEPEFTEEERLDFSNAESLEWEGPNSEQADEITGESEWREEIAFEESHDISLLDRKGSELDFYAFNTEVEVKQVKSETKVWPCREPAFKNRKIQISVEIEAVHSLCERSKHRGVEVSNILVDVNIKAVHIDQVHDAHICPPVLEERYICFESASREPTHISSTERHRKIVFDVVKHL